MLQLLLRLHRNVFHVSFCSSKTGRSLALLLAPLLLEARHDLLQQLLRYVDVFGITSRKLLEVLLRKSKVSAPMQVVVLGNI